MKCTNKLNKVFYIALTTVLLTTNILLRMTETEIIQVFLLHHMRRALQ